MSIAFALQVDRVALGKYFVSGELLPGTSGNLTMFAVPQQYGGARDTDENFLQVIHRADFRQFPHTCLIKVHMHV